MRPPARFLWLSLLAAAACSACGPAPAADTPTAGTAEPTPTSLPSAAASATTSAAPTSLPSAVASEAPAVMTAAPAASVSAAPTASVSAAPASGPPKTKVAFEKDPHWYDKPGGLTLAQIKKAAPAFFNDIAVCNDKFGDGGKKTGVQLKIEPDGKVSYSYASGGMKFSDCAQEAAKKWVFPAAKKQSEPILDLKLDPGN